MKSKAQTLKRKLWKLTSEYIRRKYSDDNGYVTCVTCQSSKHWKEVHAGHFIPKNKGLSIYFTEENIHPQCPYCNTFLHGNLKNYTLFMIDTYGREKIEELENLSKTQRKISVKEYEDLILEAKQKIGELG